MICEYFYRVHVKCDDVHLHFDFKEDIKAYSFAISAFKAQRSHNILIEIVDRDDDTPDWRTIS